MPYGWAQGRQYRVVEAGSNIITNRLISTMFDTGRGTGTGTDAYTTLKRSICFTETAQIIPIDSSNKMNIYILLFFIKLKKEIL